MTVRRTLSLLTAAVLGASGGVVVAGVDATNAGADPVPAAGGAAFGWGYNVNGQLGNGSTTTSANPAPAQLPAGVTVTQVAAGNAHTLALGSDGAVYAWGDNTYGELGNGTTTARKVPVAVTAPSGVTFTAVAAGYVDSFALAANGTVYSWGYNGLAELGNGTVTTAKTPGPVSLPAGVTATSISTGYGHTLAVTSTGALYAWGYNSAGQIGDGTATSRATPVLVHLPAGTTVTGASAGFAHSLAATSTGGVYAWGYNATGQLGIGTKTTSAVPVAVNVGSATITAVSAGQTHSLALTSAGGVLAWGDNATGELGSGAAGGVTTAPAPVAVDGAVVTSIGAGAAFSLVLTATGAVRGFGDNTYGELGTGTTTSSATPVAAKLPAGAVVSSIGVGSYSLTSFAVVPVIASATTVASSVNPSAPGQPVTLTATVTPTDGAGTVAFGSGGASITGCSAAPLTRVSGSTYRATCSVSSLPSGTDPVGATYSGDTQYAAGSGSLSGGQIVRAVDGVATAWGYNASGQLGNGSTAAKTLPVTPNLPDGTTVVQLAGDGAHTLALTSTGTVYAVYAWGDNAYGELGTGTTTSSTVPVPVPLPAGVTPVSIAAGSYTSLLVTTSGALYAWGLNNYGQLGDGTTTNRTTPTAAALPTGTVVTAAAAGLAHTVALTSTGGVYAWGLNNYGQLGIGTTTNTPIPAAVTLPTGTVAGGISAGYAHTLALTTDGKVLAWGDNSGGELGNGTVTAAKSPVATSLPTGTTVTAVVGSFYDSFALVGDGSVLAWGLNTNGQLGNGTTTAAVTPKAVSLPRGTTATAIAADAYSAQALTSDGAVYAWGDNAYGELGTGTTTSSPSPVKVHLPDGGRATAIGGSGYGLSSFAVVPRIAGATTVTSAPNPSTYGDTVTIVATVAPTDNGGTVAFTADGSAITGCDAVAVGSAGTATCAVSTLDVGNHPIRASYSGDRLYQPSSGSVDGGQTVQRIPTSTSVTTSINPGTYKQPITFTATVTGSDAGGTVAFSSDGTTIGGCSAQPTTAAGGAYTATCTTTALAGGSHVITADYSGDAHYAPSTGTLVGGQTVKVTTKLVAAPVKLTSLLAKPIYKATLTAQPDGTPVAGEQVTFYADVTGESISCTAITGADGVATCQGKSPVTLGTYHARYAGSGLYYSSEGYSNITL